MNTSIRRLPISLVIWIGWLTTKAQFCGDRLLLYLSVKNCSKLSGYNSVLNCSGKNMKRRNAESGKMRRPIKRTKISEGMYGNSFVYLRSIMLYSAFMLAEYLLEFRFEFLWPLWVLLRSVYESFKYQGLAVSVFFMCVAITSDVICFFIIPVQWLFVAASTYVWIQYVWFTVAEKGICLPTVILCCILMYVEGSFRTKGGGLEGGGYALCKPFAANCVGYPVVLLGISVISYVGGGRIVVDSQSSKEDKYSTCNGSSHGSPGPRRRRHEHANGHCHNDYNYTNNKVEKLSHNNINRDKDSKHSHTNGFATTMIDLNDEERRDASRGSSKSVKCEKKETSASKEERRKNKNKEKDKDYSDKCIEQCKESILREKDLENVKIIKENGSIKDKEREREARECKEYLEELKRVRIELATARSGEEEARRALTNALGIEKQKRNEYNQLKIQHTALQQKVQTWRVSERASLERRLSEERRARALAEQQLIRIQHHTQQRKSNECDSEWCRNRRSIGEAESAALRRELQRAREHAQQLQRELTQATEQIRSIENRSNESANSRLANAWTTLQERATHLERSLSAETRVKLDLLSALGEAKRQLNIREGTITQQEKEIDELKAQMLAVMPLENCYHANNGGLTNLRLSDRSPLDPNASVYTPKQLCSDA